jgi:hypothetical protein
MTDIVVYPTDSKLREYLLTDADLTFAEKIYPGYVRVLASGRYNARLVVERRVWNFSVRDIGYGERDVISDEPPNTPPMLRKLAWHRAAEVMLAHRSGHAEAQRNQKLRKARELERQEA